ncbi:hypothetical protein MMC16_006192 [Acarospora aff. strigata]|nr:hypothetical protein [Acarospora aff. strigata]
MGCPPGVSSGEYDYGYEAQKAQCQWLKASDEMQFIEVWTSQDGRQTEVREGNLYDHNVEEWLQEVAASLSVPMAVTNRTNTWSHSETRDALLVENVLAKRCADYVEGSAEQAVLRRSVLKRKHSTTSCEISDFR